MDEPDIRYLLSHLKIPHQKATYTGSVKRTRWMVVSCPFAPWTHQKKTDNHPSFGITIKPDGRSAYKCLSCQMKGRFASLPGKLGGYRKIDYTKLRLWAESTEMQAQLFKPVPKWEDADPVAIDYSERQTGIVQRPDPSVMHRFPHAIALPYLHKRGLGLFDVLRLGLRYDSFQRRVLFPVYDPEDRFCGFTGRSVLSIDWTKENPKVRDYYGLNKREVFLKLPGRYEGKKIISEGLFDFATAIKHGHLNSRAILGTALTPEKIEILIQEGEPVYFFMDNDLAGWQALFGIFDEDENLVTDNAWAYKLYKEIPVWIVPYRTNLTGEDPGGILDKKEYNAMLKRAWLFTGKAPLNGPAQPSTLRPKQFGHNKLLTKRT